jgi:hypothetical protein
VVLSTAHREHEAIFRGFDEIIAAASRKAQTVVTASSSALPTRKVHADILSETWSRHPLVAYHEGVSPCAYRWNSSHSLERCVAAEDDVATTLTQIVKNKAIMVIYKKKNIFLFESTVIVEPATFEWKLDVSTRRC